MVSQKKPSKYNKIDNHYVKTDSFSNSSILLIYFSLFVGISPFSGEGRAGHTYHIPLPWLGITSTEILTCLDLSHFPWSKSLKLWNFDNYDSKFKENTLHSLRLDFTWVRTYNPERPSRAPSIQVRLEWNIINVLDALRRMWMIHQYKHY